MDTIEVNDLAAIPKAAEQIVKYLDRFRVVAFYGEMGVGKTTLIREIATQMGVEDSVTSPTFAIVNQYVTGVGSPMFHFDFYRIDKVDEAFDMGYEEYFYGGDLCLIEWPEKIEPLLPQDTLRITITTDPTDPNRRIISLL